MGTIRLEITAFDIANGIPDHPCLCPVAWAFYRLFPESSPMVASEEVALTIDGEQRYLRLPKEVVQFYDNFDGGVKVEPAVFLIDDHDLWNPAHDTAS